MVTFGRNREVLEGITRASWSGRVEVATISGNVEADVNGLKAFGEADAFLDISPPVAAGSTHIKSGILALRHGGRVGLMGGIRNDVLIPHSAVMHGNLTLKGKWMYKHDDIKNMIKLVGASVPKLGEKAGFRVVPQSGLGEWEAAFTAAEENAGMEVSVLIVP